MATNIAETSLTVPGVTAVVDSGLHKVARYDADRGIDSLETERITADDGASYVGQSVLPKGGWTALMYASRQGALASATALADAGADLDAVDPDGSSALMFAIINGHYDVATLLVAKGASVNLGDRTGATPLYSAVDMHTMPTSFGRPELTPTVIEGSVGAVKMLLAHGADPNARLKDRIVKRQYNAGDPRLGEGATPFMRAARGGDLLVMRLLLEAGGDPRLAQKNGNTPASISPATLTIAAPCRTRSTSSRCAWTRASISTPSTPRAIRRSTARLVRPPSCGISRNTGQSST